MTALAARLAGHLARGIVMIFVVATVSFFVIRNIPGDPLLALREKLLTSGADPAAADQAVRVAYGFYPSGPLGEQYLDYLRGLLTLDLGVSTLNPGVPVTGVLAEAAAWTVLPVLAGTLLSFLAGVTLGVYAAVKRAGGLGDLLAVSGSLLHGVPQYVLALLLAAIFATSLGWFPAEGGVADILVEPGLTPAYLGTLLHHATLPVLTYALSAYGGWLLAMRSSVVTVLGDDFILAAELRGVRRSILLRYLARNAILPLFTILAISLGTLFAGAVFIERVFTYPGLGLTLVDSVTNRDYALMGGAFLLVTGATVVANLVADLLYTVIDPRVRGGREAG